MKKLAFEHGRQDLDMDEELLLEGHEMGLVKGQTTTGKDAVQMRVITKILAPGMEHQSEAGNNPLLFSGQLQKRPGSCLVHQIIEFLLVIEDQGVQGVGNGEDQMEVM